MGGGRASASVRPDESTALPPLPSYDLPLWNEHSKDKLQGVLTRKGSLAKHVKHQEKAFGPFLPCVKDQIAAFQAESEKGMEAFARIGRCLVTGATMESVFVDGSAVLDASGGRESALCPGYTYDHGRLQLLIARPKSAPRSRKLPALVWAHAGGIATTARNWDFCGKAWAKALAAVVVIVDFRNGGDAEAPAGTMDMLAAIRWVVANAESIGVDAGRVSLMANSGGGLEGSSVCLELAARGEAHVLKAAFLDVPMIFPDDMLGPYEGWSAWKRFEHEVVMRQQYLCYAGRGWEARWAEKPAWLHVLAAPEALIRRAPAHVLLSTEFDMMRWQHDEYAARLHRCGVLADYVLLPGAAHTDATPFNAKFVKIYKQAFDLYG